MIQPVRFGNAPVVAPVVRKFSYEAFKATCPITARLFNLRELLIMGALTRYGIGLLRVEENIPRANRKGNLTREQKYSSLLERVFMEAIGVPFHLLSLYIPQELVAKAFERSKFLKLPGAVKGLSVEQNQLIQKTLRQVYWGSETATRPMGLVAQQLYGRSELAAKYNVAVHAIKKAMNGRPKTELKSVLNGLNTTLYAMNKRLWTVSALALSTGVLVSAVLTGYVMQSLNDHVVSKRVIPWILRKVGIAPKTPQEPIYIPGPVPFDESQRTFRM